MSREERIQVLEHLVAAQSDRIRELEAINGLDDRCRPPIEWGLPRREAQIFAMLVARERVTKDAIHAVVYGGSSDVDPSVVETHVSKLRKRIAQYGVEIVSTRHLGYQLIDRQKYRRAS